MEKLYLVIKAQNKEKRPKKYFKLSIQSIKIRLNLRRFLSKNFIVFGLFYEY